MGVNVGEIRRGRAPATEFDAPVRAITFDFWNTVMFEPEGGLEAARVDRWEALLDQLGSPRPRPAIVAAHASAVADQQAAWLANEQYVTADATRAMLAFLELDLSMTEAAAFDAIFVHAALGAGVCPCDGIEATLRRCRAAGLRLAIICDIGLTPAVGVRALLTAEDLLYLFDATVFSDEQGTYKPDVRIFEHALSTLGVDADAAVHVGDRRRTDVAGALDAGMRAVRYRAVFDDCDATFRDAPVVIDDHRELASLGAIP
jgi:putative hydrolase of the HAD superfamily